MNRRTEIDPWAKPALSLPTVLAANVQRMRKAKGWSQEQLSRRSWMTRQTVRSVELGDADIKLSTVEQIAMAFRVDPITLLRESKATRAYLHANPPSPGLAVISRHGERTEDPIQAPLMFSVSSD